MNILKTSELHILKWWILCYMNISIKIHLNIQNFIIVRKQNFFSMIFYYGLKYSELNWECKEKGFGILLRTNKFLRNHLVTFHCVFTHFSKVISDGWAIKNTMLSPKALVTSFHSCLVPQGSDSPECLSRWWLPKVAACVQGRLLFSDHG